MVTPPALPPTVPPVPSWMAARNPSAHIVQQQYVDLRLEELGAGGKPGMKDALEVLDFLLASQPQFSKCKKIPTKELKRVYEQMERNLQSADLTINFEANGWFSDENLFDTYTRCTSARWWTARCFSKVPG
jgi:hypothetical protein